MTVDPRFTYQRAAADYDQQFEHELTDAITESAPKKSRLVEFSALRRAI